MKNKRLDEWKSTTYEAFRKKGGERFEQFKTAADIPVEPVFAPEQPDDVYHEKLGFPGEYPFTRGVYPNMYRGRFWTMRQYAGFGSAAETNERFHFLLKQGQTGLSVAFDLPTQMGYDPDAPQAQGEVGKVGVSIATLDDMRTLLKGIPLDQVSTSMTINATAATLLAFYAAVAEENGVPVSKIEGTVQNDILKEYMARGTYIYPPAPSMRLITNLFSWCREQAPQWNTISISGYHIREAGCDAVQEVAFTLADGIAYVEAAIRAGLDVDEFAGRLSFFFNGHNNFMEEVAKFRAARRMWAKIMKDRFGAKKDNSLKLRFHTQTAGSMLTAQQPINNIVRVAIQALAAVMGGTQSLHTNSYDEALSLPTEQAAAVALRTQQIIAHESGAADSCDPLGGSWMVEKLTSEIEDRAWEYIRRIDDMGGMVEAISSGYPQREIQERAYQWNREVESGLRVVVGVNRFQTPEPPPRDILRVREEVEREQLERLRAFKSRRSAADAAAALASLKICAQGTDNLMGPVFHAVKTGATLGEIANVLRSVFGEYREVKTI